MTSPAGTGPPGSPAGWPFTPVPAIDPELERAALGAIMLHPAVARSVLPHLRPEQFADLRHRDLLTVLQDLHRQDGAVDPLSAECEVTRRAADGILGGNHRAVLHASLIDAPRSDAAGLSCAQLVVENSVRRRLAQTAITLLATAQDGRGGLTDLLGRANLETDQLRRDLAGHQQTLSELRGLQRTLPGAARLSTLANRTRPSPEPAALELTP